MPEGELPPGYLHVLDATGARDEPVELVHEDSEPLRRMAVFDIVTNNTDRKGGHVLPMADGHRYGVDHGVCFHVEDKLRTVLWGWAGQRLTVAERAGVECVLDGLGGELRDRLEDLLTVREVDAIERRCQRLLSRVGSRSRPVAGRRSRGLRSEGRPIGFGACVRGPLPSRGPFPGARADRPSGSSTAPRARCVTSRLRTARRGCTSAGSRRTTPPTWATPRRTSPSTC